MKAPTAKQRHQRVFSLHPLAPLTISPPPPSIAMYYDDAKGTTRCVGTKGCSLGNLLLSRGTMNVKQESSYPNTRDSCIDGNYGTYLNAESVKRITISFTSGAVFTAGKEVSIVAKVHINYWYTSYASRNSPTRTHTPPGGIQVIKPITFTLDSSDSLQTVPVMIKYSASNCNKCLRGSLNDIDNLLFEVPLG